MQQPYKFKNHMQINIRAHPNTPTLKLHIVPNVKYKCGTQKHSNNFKVI